MSISHFSTTLGAVVERLGYSQAQFAKMVGMPSPSLNRYIRAKHRPSVDVLEQLGKALPQEAFKDVLIAHLEDELPQRMRPSIAILSKDEMYSSIAQETPQEYVRKLPPKLAAAIRVLEDLAVKSPEVADWILATAKLLAAAEKQDA